MKRLLIAALLLSLSASPLRAADEPELRDAAVAAVWPGDIVRASERYLERYPAGVDAAEMRELRDRARRASRLLSGNEVRLYRSAFVAAEADSEQRAELRRAALGDSQAAVRLAQASREASDPRTHQRYVGWLQLASVLGDERATYELALHFRRTDQPIFAAHYEALALAMGFVPAPSLDHARK